MRTFVVAVCVLAGAGAASAQNLKLEFHEGKVSIDATGVPVRTILSEWARLGGTQVVGGDRVAGAPLTVKLENVPEAQALEIVLRNVAGYMAAPRRLASTGASAYDRILVMPTSVTQSASAAPGGRSASGNANSAAQRNGRQVFGPGVAPEPDVPSAPMPDVADTGVNEPPFSFPQPNPFQAGGQPGAFGTPMPPSGQAPVIQFGQGAGQAVSINPTPEQPAPTLQFPGMPTGGAQAQPTFGTVGAPTPGVILQPAQPAQPGRPPGSR